MLQFMRKVIGFVRWTNAIVGGALVGLGSTFQDWSLVCAGLIFAAIAVWVCGWISEMVEDP